MHLHLEKALLTLTILLNSTTHTFAQGQIPQSLPLRNPFQPSFVNATSNEASASPTTKHPNILPEYNTYQYKLNYVAATEIKEALQSIFSAGKISAEALSNSIIFWGTSEEAQRLQKAINGIDNPSYQITLEAKIISLNNEENQNLGVAWNWDSLPQVANNNNKNNSSNTDTNEHHGNFKFWRDYSLKFAATLNALQSKGKAKILASPRIITLPGKKASIFIGDHIPVQTEQHNSSGNYTSTEYLDAGIKLEYTPIVNAEGTMVTAAVHTEVSTPSLISEIKNYKITSRTVDTSVRMKNGETLVIGGLISDEEQKTIQQIPLLSKLPILGNLFKNKNHTKTKTEVILILTPHITKSGQSPAIYQNNFNALAKKSIKY